MPRVGANPNARLQLHLLLRALPEAFANGGGASHILRQQAELTMSDLNKVLLIGRLGAKPELNHGQNGVAVCRMSVATAHSVQQDDRWERHTTWHKVVAFDRLAERCGEFLDKGKLVFVEGQLRADDWKDKDGVVHKGREIRASAVRHLGQREVAQGEAEHALAAVG